VSEVTVVLNVNEVAVTKQVTDIDVVQLVQQVGLTSPGPQGPRGPAGPAGAPGGSAYEHVQSTPAATWIITHNLGRFSHVSLLEDDGTEFEADVVHADINTVVVTFPSPHTGTAIVS
jgi:hypothetical protein